MKKEDKCIVIEQIKSTLANYTHFYLADISSLNAAKTSDLRRKCFKNDIKLMVVKNTLLKKALEGSDVDFSSLYDSLKGDTALMFTNTGNTPAKVIKEFRKASDKPVLKAAYVEESFYFGDNELDSLCAIKSKNELIADIIALLQSPAKNVVSALQSGGNTLHGVLETLSKK